MDEPKKFLTVGEAAQYLRYSKTHLLRLAREDKIKHHRSPGRVLFCKEDLDEFLVGPAATPTQ